MLHAEPSCLSRLICWSRLIRIGDTLRSIAVGPGEIGAAWLAVKWLSSSAFILRFILDLTQTRVSGNA
jgi:hypothetical protein